MIHTTAPVWWSNPHTEGLFWAKFCPMPFGNMPSRDSSCLSIINTALNQNKHLQEPSPNTLQQPGTRQTTNQYVIQNIQPIPLSSLDIHACQRADPPMGILIFQSSARHMHTENNYYTKSPSYLSIHPAATLVHTIL